MWARVVTHEGVSHLHAQFHGNILLAISVISETYGSASEAVNGAMYSPEYEGMSTLSRPGTMRPLLCDHGGRGH